MTARTNTFLADIESTVSKLEYRDALRLPRFQSESIEILDIHTTQPAAFPNGLVVALEETPALLSKLASRCHTEAQLVSHLEDAIRSGFRDVSVTFRRQGGTSSESPVWTLRVHQPDSESRGREGSRADQ